MSSCEGLFRPLFLNWDSIEEIYLLVKRSLVTIDVVYDGKKNYEDLERDLGRFKKSQKALRFKGKI